MTSTSTRLPALGSGGGSGEDTLLRGKYVRTTRFASIGASTSGTITLPASSEVVLDDFGGTTDAIVAQISGGRPTLQPALTASGEIVATSFNSSGDWVLTGTPSAYPVAIIYRVRQTFENFDSTSSDICGIADYEGTTTLIQVFSSSGTYTKPAGAKTADVYLMGGGGGGGSGRCDVAGTVRCAGGGGASSLIVARKFDASLISSSVTITVGAGGTGGTGKATVGDGNPGTAGGDTTFGAYLKALGGAAGAAGTASSGVGGSATVQQSSIFNTIQRGGASASATGTNAATAGLNDIPSPLGGGAGGGVSAANASGQGSSGGSITSSIADNLGISGGAAGAAAPANAGDGNNTAWMFGLQIGTGGGGSRGGVSTNSGNGGNGGKGAGGGGAGAVTSGFTGGNGGNGGDGWAIVITSF